MDMGLTDEQLDKLYGRDIPKDEPLEIYILRQWYPMNTKCWNWFVKRIEWFWNEDESERLQMLQWRNETYYRPSLIKRIKQRLSNLF